VSFIPAKISGLSIHNQGGNTMTMTINEADRVEILTLQDNYIDLVSGDSTEMLQRALPLKGGEVKNSVLAEHGFSTLVTITTGEVSHSILFDFGFSEHGAAFNADALNVDLTGVETLALSHGHVDHVGGLEQLSGRVGKKGIELVLHPTAFRRPRYLKIMGELKVYFPPSPVKKFKPLESHCWRQKNPIRCWMAFSFF
jgi:7,8-dihydropterin-6-yl-methyl-4-(beta-D-ribofuranosyl)aminobenzene 5'-phosphate synthase